MNYDVSGGLSKHVQGGAVLLGLAGLVVSGCEVAETKVSPAKPMPVVQRQVAKRSAKVKQSPPLTEQVKCANEYLKGKNIKTCKTYSKGKVVSVKVLVYNPKGGLVLERIDGNNNGVFEEVIEYDGSDTEDPLSVREEYDRNEDGKLDRIVSHMLQKKRDYTLVMMEKRDEDGDGTFEYHAKQIFIPSKRKTILFIDKDNNGRTDAYVDEFFDEKGELVEKRYDDNGDRKSDRIEMYKEGKLVTRFVIKERKPGSK